MKLDASYRKCGIKSYQLKRSKLLPLNPFWSLIAILVRKGKEGSWSVYLIIEVGEVKKDTGRAWFISDLVWVKGTMELRNPVTQEVMNSKEEEEEAYIWS